MTSSPPSPLRWLFHVVRASAFAPAVVAGRYRAASLASEGFVHASYRDVTLESARLYFAGAASDELRVLAIDPRRLDVPIEVAKTPRGPMPHLHGLIPADAYRVLALGEVESHPDVVTGTKIGFAAFDGMTLLDLVGPLDAVSRIASMNFDPTTTCEVFALKNAGGERGVVWRGANAAMAAVRERPPLDGFDVLVLPGGLGTRALAKDPAIVRYLATYPENRLLATVCTGALLAGAIGRLTGKRATTHASALADLESFGATASNDRVVDEGQLVTAGGVTSGIDLGIHLVRRLAGDDVAAKVAAQMEARV